MPLPNLSPFTPANWTESIILPVIPGTTMDSELLIEDDPIYLDWAVKNIGNGTITSTATDLINEILVDSASVKQVSTSLPFYAGNQVAKYDLPRPGLSAGVHEIRTDAYPDNLITETHESDNVYMRMVNIWAKDHADKWVI